MEAIRSRKTFCFDLDGTLCTAQGRDYGLARPFPWAIERVNALHAAGHEIIIMTARGAATGIDWSELTREQLERWGVSYDELRFGKPRADVFIDDRGLHTDEWRADDAFGLPGYDRGGPARKLPTTMAGHVTCVVEAGRTFAGRALRLDQHVDRVRALAEGAGVRVLPPAADVREAVERVLPGALAAAGEDVVYAIRLTDPAAISHLDVWDCALRASLYVSCRPLRQSDDGLRRLWAPDGEPGVAAVPDAGPMTAWPVGVGADGIVEDLLGGQLAAVHGRVLTLAPARPTTTVAGAWLQELAVAEGLQVRCAPVTAAHLRMADEAFVTGFPFCIVPFASFDGAPLGQGADGVAHRLLRAWESATGVNLPLGPAQFTPAERTSP